MRHLSLVVNPASGHGRGRRLTPRIEQRFADAGVRLTTTLATSADHAASACEDAVTSGTDGLVVVGGDGMAHIGLNACARTGVPLGVVPAGTGNDFAHGVGFFTPRTLAQVAVRRRPPWLQATDVIVAGRTRAIDLAEVSGRLYRGELAYVGCVVSTGFDERVNFRANNAPLDLGTLSYAAAVIAEVRRFKPLRYRLVLDGVERELDAMLVAVANVGLFGGNIHIVPDYDLADGLLDVIIVHPVSWRVLAALFPRIASGQTFDHPALERLRVRSVVVDGPDLYGMADGEPLGRPPLTCTAVPGALTLFTGA